MSESIAGRMCRTRGAHPPTPAVILGTFDPTSGMEEGCAETDAALCLRCAALDHAVGWFTPNDLEEIGMLMEHYLFVTREEPRPGTREPR